MYKELLIKQGNDNQPTKEEEIYQSCISNIPMATNEQDYAAIGNDSKKVVYNEIYAIYVPGSASESLDYNDFVFSCKKECLSHLRKHKGARFKAFQNQNDALNFAMYGPTPISRSDKPLSAASSLKEERPSPFPTPTPQQYIQFRKTIERGDLNLFNQFVATNPRYLVSKADTPSLLKEGPRYNAIHVACIHNKPEMCSRILVIVSNPEFFKLIYPDDTDKCTKLRSSRLLDLYLNTPDKGFNRTPLHYCSTFGFIDCIKILVSYPNCSKDAVDKYNNTALQLIYTRAKAPNEDIRKDIQVLLGDHYYVPIFRDEEELFSPKIAEPMSPSFSQSPENNNEKLNDSVGEIFSPTYKLHGYAGPMNYQTAKNFYSKWREPLYSSPKTPNKINLVNINLESIGRDLALDQRLSWKEYWDFLDEFINITSSEGLKKLDAHFKKKLNEVLLTKNEMKNFDDSCISKCFDESDCAAKYDISNNSSRSTIGGLCKNFNDLKLNKSLTSTGKSSNLTLPKSYESNSPIVINNNSIDAESDSDSFDYMNYILKSTAITSSKISPIFEKLCTNSKNSMIESKIQIVRSDICVELSNLRNVICRLNVDRDFEFSFVHAALSSRVVEYFINKSMNISGIEGLLGKFDKLSKSGDPQEQDAQIYTHFKCVCTYLIEMVAKNSKNKVVESPTHLCLCSWSVQCVNDSSEKGIKYKKANWYLHNLLFSEDQAEKKNIVARHLSFSEDESILLTEDDKDSFVTADSSIQESMRTPDELFCFFIYGLNPSRTDNLVFTAIEKIKIDHEKFPFISQWIEVVDSYTIEERKSWPSTSGNKREEDLNGLSQHTQFSNVISSTPKLLKTSFYSHFDRTS